MEETVEQEGSSMRTPVSPARPKEWKPNMWECGRSGGERNGENVGECARRQDPRSHMHQHISKEHPELMEGEDNTHKHFRMKVLKQHNKPLGRLLHEALRQEDLEES